jgi:Zn-dependent protease
MLGPIDSTITLEDVASLRQSIADLYVIEDTTIGWPHKGYVRFRGRFRRDSGPSFIEIRRRFEGLGFTPLLRRDAGEPVLLAMPLVFDPPRSNPWVNLLLLLLTIASTVFAGATSDPAFTGSEWWLGIPFSASLMLILGAHELGHYFAARHHGVSVTLPYFIPLPISLIGTLGAFIRLKAPVTNRRALLDIGAAGPLMGLVFAIPILLIGLSQSEVRLIAEMQQGVGIVEGNSLFYSAAKYLIFGRFLPDGTADVFIGPLALAGWVGLLVTGLNLLPVGQLDGGHITYTLFGPRAKQLFWPVLLALLGLVLLLGDQGLQWVLWIFLLFFFGNRHAQPLDDYTPLDPRRRAIAILSMVVFIVVFVPVPITVVMPAGGLG